MALLTIQNLCTVFEKASTVTKAVNGLDLTIEHGETLALVGESGSGKSITALSILRLVPPPGRIIEGSIHLEDRNLLQLNSKEMQRIRGRQIGLIMQDPLSALNPVIRVGEQIAEVLRQHFQYSQKKAKADALEMMHTVQLKNGDDIFNKYAHQLSGGERQRIVIAIALACRPQLLIADEPTTALDVTIQSQILNLLKSLKERLNLAMLLITHDLGIVSQVADRVAVMYAGTLVEQAATADLYQNPRHPYTQLLLHAMPKVPFDAVDKVHKFEIKPKQNELQHGTGCAFADRCPVVEQPCQETVHIKSIDNGRLLRCIH